MLSETNKEFNFNTKEEENDFLKTRVEFLGLSKRTQDALIGASIRTVGGIINKSRFSLINTRGLGWQELSEIQSRLKSYFKFRDKNEKGIQRKYLENKPLIKILYLDQSAKTITDELHNNDDIICLFAKYFGISKGIIESKTRKKNIVEIRDLTAYLLREYADMSFTAIGKLLGGRDHTTVIHSCRKIAKNISLKKDFELKFSELIIKLRSIKERKFYIEKKVIPQIIVSVNSQITSRSQLRGKEISSRDNKILELYREGLTLENISKVVKVSRERIRQIVEKTIKQIAINDSILKGIDIDAKVLLEEEKKKRNVKKKGVIDKISKINKEKRWSRYYFACKLCGTTIIPHVKKGLCEYCIGNFRGERRESIIIKHQNRCDICKILRELAIKEFGRDFYITKEKNVLCRKCFLKKTGKILGENYGWGKKKKINL